GIPDGALSIETDAIGDAVAQIGPYSAVRQIAIDGNVEGCELLAMGLSNNQRRIVGRYNHAVRKGEVGSHPLNRAVWRDERHDFTIYVGIAAAINNDLVPAFVR